MIKAYAVEKRRSVRIAAAHPAVIWNRGGRVIARGRTANISETGVFVIARCPGGLTAEGDVLVEIQVPATAAKAGKNQTTRTVRYRCRVVRTRTLGHLVGVGVEFLEKLA